MTWAPPSPLCGCWKASTHYTQASHQPWEGLADDTPPRLRIPVSLIPGAVGLECAHAFGLSRRNVAPGCSSLIQLSLVGIGPHSILLRVLCGVRRGWRLGERHALRASWCVRG